MNRDVNHLIQSDALRSAKLTGGRADTACGLSLPNPRVGLDLPTCERCIKVYAVISRALEYGWNEGYLSGHECSDTDLHDCYDVDNPYRSEP